jgi:hypothetical protein
MGGKRAINERRAGMDKETADRLREARHYVREAIVSLDVDFPNWNDTGQKYAVDCALKACDEAWRRINLIILKGGRE